MTPTLGATIATLYPFVASAGPLDLDAVLNPYAFIRTAFWRLVSGQSVTDGIFSDVISALGEPLMLVVKGITLLIFKVAGFFLQSMAMIMDVSIELTISSGLMNSLQVIDIGWTAVRDFANMFFIFALLYIAIQTILGLAGGNTKRLIAHLIIAAVLINFSLFATKVVIDAGNVLAVSFWSKLKVQAGQGNMVNSASSKFLSGLDLQTILATKEKNTGKALGLKTPQEILVYAGGAVFMFIAGYIFLAAALMMVTRTIMLILLMIFSPFAFMAFGFPRLEQYGQKWLDKLIKQTFVAPFFIFMLYINSVLIDKTDIFTMSGAKDATFTGALSGADPTSYAIIFNFIILIGFLIASLIIANNFAGETGSRARGWAMGASKWAGGMATAGAVGTGAFAMRQSMGKIGAMGADNKALHEQAAEKGWRGSIARGKLAMYGGMSKATYDPRATKLGKTALSGGGRIDVGEGGGKGGFKATGSALAKTTFGAWGTVGTEEEKKVLAIAEERYKNDPAGKEAYLRANLGTRSRRDAETGKLVGTSYGEKISSLFKGESRYEKESEFKTTRQTIEREKETVVAKDDLKKNIEVYKNADQNTAEGQAIGKAAAEVIKQSLAKLSGKEAADTLDNKQLRLSPVIAALNNQHLAGLNARTDLEPETVEAITKGVIVSGTPSAQKYLRNQARLGSGNFQVDAEKELEKLSQQYDQEKKTFDANHGKANTDVLNAWKERAREMKEQTSRFLGMMETNEIAELDDALIAHEMVLEGYASNTKVAGKIRERLNNNLYSDTVTPVLQERFGKQSSQKQSPLAQAPQQNVYTPKPGDTKPQTTDGGPMQII